MDSDRDAAALRRQLADPLLAATHPVYRPLLWTLLGCVLLFIGWAAWAQLDEVTRGDGRVVPFSRIQKIQSLEGGILGPGEEHDAEAQAVAEDIVGVDVQCLEHDHRERAEEQQQPEHVAAQLHGNQAGVVQQEQRRGDGGERVYQFGRDQEVLDESSPCQRQAIYRLRMHVVCSADHGQSIEWIGKSKAVKCQFSDYFSFATRFSHFPVE